LNSIDPVGASIETLSLAFRKKGDTERALGMSRYMKGRFEYFGIMAVDRKTIFKSNKIQFLNLVKQGLLEETMIRLWEYDEREMQYCALELLDSSRKYYTPQTLDLIERLILSKSWWDTVDMLAGKTAGYLFILFPDLQLPRVTEWITHADFWINRSAIIHQLNYKNKTDFELLKKAILPHIHSSEFFLRKAIGWALRQYSRTNPQEVIQFVQEQGDLSNLSKKEALRLVRTVNT